MLCSPLFIKVPSLIANFHSSFYKTTMQTLSHLTCCTHTNSGLCFAISVFCVSKFNIPFSSAEIIPKYPLKSKSRSNIFQHSGFLSSNTKYRNSPLFGCLPLLINYICIYPPYLETVPYICSLMKCCVMLPRG